MIDLDETVNVIGNSGKRSKISYGDLLKKKISGKVEVYGKTYYARITRWYRLDKEFKSLSEATTYLVKFIQKVDKMKSEKK